MASAKALAAIALTLIVAIPIGLGYGLASQSVEYDTWINDGNANLSDTILNYSTPYTNDSWSSNNNSQLLQVWQFPNAGATETHVVTPDYVSKSSNPSSLPVYTDTTSYYALGQASVGTHTSPGGTAWRIGSSNAGITPNAAYVTNLDYIHISITTSASGIHFDLTTDVRSSYINPGDGLDLVRDGDGTWQITYNGDQTINHASRWLLTTDASATFRVVYNRFTTISNLGNSYSFNTDPDLKTALKLSIADGDQYIITDTETAVAVNGTNVFVGGSIYSGVNGVSVVYPASDTQILVTKLAASGDYGDPARGWKIPIPDYENVVFYTWWMNSFSNGSVTFMLNFSDDATVYLGPANGTTNLATYTVESSNGVISINGDALGAYSSIQAIISTHGAQFTGISTWPSMGAAPVALNSITVEGSFPLFSTVRLHMDPDDIPNVSYRVDRSEVLAGYFPSTKDFTLDLVSLFPNKINYAVKINSVGVFGDFINIGGARFNVENGRLILTEGFAEQDATVPIKGMVIRILKTDNGYEAYINSIRVNLISPDVRIFLGGEWSMTMTAEFSVETTGTREEWAPGEFAFDEDGFKTAIILAALAAFIGVGLYGARSGVKVGLLIMICGGAALVAMIMV